MGEKITIELKKRDLFGKKVKQLRKEGLTPVIVYGAGIEATPGQVESGAASKVFKAAGHHAPVHLTVDGKKKIAMIKDVDIDPVRHDIRHMAFHAVKQNQPVEAEVAVRLIGEGESEAEKAGLVILQALDTVQVKALPMDLPEAIEVDITGLKEAGEKVTLADAKLPKDVELVEHDDGRSADKDDEEEKPSITDLMVASVWEPAALQAANEAAAGDAEDESEVEAENGSDTDQTSQDEETKPGGKDQDEPKQSNVDANK